MRGLAYDILEDGHRRFNLQTWQETLGLTPWIARPSLRIFLSLLRAERVLFATLDDAPVFFAIVGVVRACLLRPTVGIFMRPHLCFRGGHIKYRLKWLYFRVLNLLPFLSAVSLIPYFVNPRLREVSRDWIYDPQNWDLVTSPPDLRIRTPLSERILAHARGRKIIAAIGGLNNYKGFSYFAEIASAAATDPTSHVFLACGPLAHDCHEAKARIEEAGGLVLNSFISDEDMTAIYGIATMVWACYPEPNDQASGIFGRASQLGIPALVREGSFNALQARNMGAPHLAIPFGRAEEAAALVRKAEIGHQAANWALVDSLKSESLGRLRALL